tara:strand:+ start:917 stop:1102 length:186 start_codon:yes stop_codon:yes gene_type:complete
MTKSFKKLINKQFKLGTDTGYGIVIGKSVEGYGILKVEFDCDLNFTQTVRFEEYYGNLVQI